MLLKTKDIYTMLRVDPMTVRNWLNNGTLSGRKINNRWYVEQSELDKLLQRPVEDEVVECK